MHAARNAGEGHDWDAELASAWTPIGDAEAVALARAQYGVDGTVVRFATEKDDTFRLDSTDGRQYVLKIAHPSEKPSELEFQVEILGHLSEQAPDLPVPRMFRDRNGAAFSTAAVAAGEPRIMRLMSYLPGTPLAGWESSVGLRENIGVVLAKLRLALAGFTHPAADRAVAWDVTHLPTLSHLVGHVTDPEHRHFVERALTLFVSIEQRLADQRRQVLHNDFNTSNIVVRACDPHTVGGIIDFGDAVRTAIAVDVSTALMNQFPKKLDWADRTDLFDEARDVLRGYLRHADLTEDELSLIPFLALGRLATRALLTSWRAELFPENAGYILRNTATSWPHLAWFMSQSRQQIADLLITHSPRGKRP